VTQSLAHAAPPHPVLRKDVTEADRVCALVSTVREAQDAIGAASPPGRQPPVVLALVGSSRGGTSLTHSLLRRSGRVRTLSGEHTHLYKLHGVFFPWRVDASDATVDHPEALPEVGREIVANASAGDVPDRVFDDATAQRFAVAWAARIVLQWPVLAPDARVVRTMVCGELSRLNSLPSQDPWDILLLRMIYRLRVEGYDINPYYYDLPAELVGRFFPTLPPTNQPPQETPTFLEEPPFLVPRPSTVLPADAADMPLVVKSSVDAYRIGHLEAVFPHSRVRVIHITRNPAASVNGLIDGWRDRGFYSYDVSSLGPLDISGYSENVTVGGWWNFDLPPGWASTRGRSVAEVCTHQWTSAHAGILAGLAETRLPCERVAAEAVMHDHRARAEVVQRILDVAGADGKPARGALHVAPVMATLPPGPARWRTRRNEVLTAVSSPETLAVAAELGYHSDEEERWI
jgi:hypothetical protein